MNELKKMDKKLLQALIGKNVKILYRDPERACVRVWFGRLVGFMDGFLLETDRFGRLHLLNLNQILKITERRDEPC